MVNIANTVNMTNIADITNAVNAVNIANTVNMSGIVKSLSIVDQSGNPDWKVIGLTAAVLLLLLLAAAGGILLWKSRHRRPLTMDECDGQEFEYYCADLLEGLGFTEIEVTRESGDYGVDILAWKDGVSYAFQCKCHSQPIGIKAVQEIYAGRDYYDCMVGVVMTNQYFTDPAVAMATKLKILLWDRDYLEEAGAEE